MSGASAVEAAARALTPEEKAAKVAKMKELVAVRRAAREEEEKVDHVKVRKGLLLLLLLFLFGDVVGVKRARIGRYFCSKL